MLLFIIVLFLLILYITPIPIFLVVISMFGSYVIQIHNLANHHRVERSLRLMFSHYFIIISINLITVAFEWLHLGGVNLYLKMHINNGKQAIL